MNGSFSPRYAKRKRWRVSVPLLYAICDTIPRGATVLDVGAGLGRYVAALRERGYGAHGFDGIEGIRELSGGLVHQMDLTSDLILAEPWDWVICIEVGEHIDFTKTLQFVYNLKRLAKTGLIVSWAIPGQRGVNHVNTQLPEWVSTVISTCPGGSWSLDRAATTRARRLAGEMWNRKLLVFRAKMDGKVNAGGR